MSDTLLDAATTSAALLSDDGRYRYWLTRDWGRGTRATFVMLNPSTADAHEDDPTIRRCIGFAKSWGYSGLMVVNLYALRSTDPRGLWAVDDPVGPTNDSILTQAAWEAGEKDALIVAAWGANAKPERVRRVLNLPFMDRLSHLGLTKAGAPKHPLYLRADTTPTRWGVESDA